MRLLIFTILIVFCVVTCKNPKSNNSDKEIENLAIKYPQVANGYLGEKNAFKLVRRIEDSRWQAIFELYEATSHIGMIIIRKNNLSYCIPLLPSEYNSYWSSKTNADLSDSLKVNTSFEKELKAANNYLALHKNNFLFFRYIFTQVLGLTEESYPDPCINELTPYPFQVQYSKTGNYTIIETVHSRDSITLEVSKIHGID